MKRVLVKEIWIQDGELVNAIEQIHYVWVVENENAIGIVEANDNDEEKVTDHDVGVDYGNDYNFYHGKKVDEENDHNAKIVWEHF